ncbi:MAG: aromatic ring-hydroxylating dioxygenase subunit alpha, partial [Parvularculaceae bacterium]|nr:aromatic ring-hydroxylating dioxygenase subunit alpha [Parvularculaceae bacterium]
MTSVAPAISPERYISRDYLEREKEKLWSNVWQVACREEEIPNVGDYVTYEIGDDSFIVVRNKQGGISAFHNVCAHRGRRLTSGCGRANQFRCAYHGWSYDLEGKNVFIQDKDDWKGCLDKENVNLRPVRLDTFGGFVWIDMREKGESLAEFLEDAVGALGPYEYENMRFRWYTTVHLDCNWKVAVEAFIEGYHVAATHPQLLHIFGDDYTNSYAKGKHSIFTYERMQAPLSTPS